MVLFFLKHFAWVSSEHSIKKLIQSFISSQSFQIDIDDSKIAVSRSQWSLRVSCDKPALQPLYHYGDKLITD